MSERDLKWRNVLCVIFPFFIISGSITVAVAGKQLVEVSQGDEGGDAGVSRRDRNLYLGYMLLTIGFFLGCVCGIIQLQINRTE